MRVRSSVYTVLTLSAAFSLLTACSTPQANMPVSKTSVKAGSHVQIRGEKVDLYPGKLRKGMNFVRLAKRTDIDFKFQDRPTIVSFVPSVDTKVCEAQTHILGEDKTIKPGVDLVTISRDLPMAQNRFAAEAKLTNIRYFSDYKTSSFGRRAGILMKGKELLARGVLVLDEKGVIQHLQIVDEVTNLPDMQAAIAVANSLLK